MWERPPVESLTGLLRSSGLTTGTNLAIARQGAEACRKERWTSLLRVPDKTCSESHQPSAKIKTVAHDSGKPGTRQTTWRSVIL